MSFLPELEVWQGNTDFLDFQALKADGTPQPITGWNLWSTAKRSYRDTDGDAVWQKTLAGGGIEMVNATLGQGAVKLLPADTEALDAPIRLYVDVKGQDPSGNIHTLDARLLSILPSITRAP